MSSFQHTEADAHWYLNLSDAHQASYAKLRLKLEEAGTLAASVDDKCSVLRFLKARLWDVEKAEAMYTNMAKWRKEHEVDNLYETYQFPELDAIMPIYPHFYHKLDKFGRPVYVELVGKTDCSKLMQVTTEQRLMDYHIFTWERFHRQLMPACSELAGRPICTTTVILDLQGLSLSNFSLVARRLLSSLSKIDQDYYPESLGIMFIINTPFIFKTIWAFVQPMLEERTRKKIHVLGADYLKHLTAVIDVENLPTMFGGKSRVANLKDSEGPWSGCEAFQAKRWLPVPNAPGKLATAEQVQELSVRIDAQVTLA